MKHKYSPDTRLRMLAAQLAYLKVTGEEILPESQIVEELLGIRKRLKFAEDFDLPDCIVDKSIPGHVVEIHLEDFFTSSEIHIMGSAHGG